MAARVRRRHPRDHQPGRRQRGRRRRRGDPRGRARRDRRRPEGVRRRRLAAHPGGRARRICWTGSPTCCSATRRPWRRWKHGTPARRSRRAGSTSTTSHRCSATTRDWSRVESDRLVDVGDPAVISRVVREPIGVCVLIAPWNYPLLQMSWKIAPALGRRQHDGGQAQRGHPADAPSRSCTCSRRRACRPAVVNLVQGSGAVLGRRADRHRRRRLHLVHRRTGHRPDHRQGGRRARHQGRRRTRRQEPAHRVRRRRLRESAVDQVLTGVFLHSGQVCSAGTRLIVEESDRRRLRRRARGRAPRRSGSATASTRPARPGRWSPSSTGPRWRPMWQLGISEGAKLVTGGCAARRPGAGRRAVSTCPRSSTGATGRCGSSRRRPSGRSSRWSGSPTEAEAIRLGNDTEYGLAAGVRTSDAARGERVVRALRHGTVWLNDFGYYTAAAEWGGFGKSGNGRELGPDGARGIPRDQAHLAQHRARSRPAGSRA